MYPQRIDTNRFHGIDDTYTYRLIDAAVSDDRITGSDADLIRLYIAERKATKNIGSKRCYKIASSLITVRRFVQTTCLARLPMPSRLLRSWYRLRDPALDCPV